MGSGNPKKPFTPWFLAALNLAEGKKATNNSAYLQGVNSFFIVPPPRRKKTSIFKGLNVRMEL